MTILLLAALSLAAGAQPASAPPQARWVSRWDRGECQLIRAVGDAQRIGLRAVPNADQISLWVFPEAAAPLPRGEPVRAAIAVPPARATVESDSVTRSGERADRVYKIDLPLSALNALAGATAIQVRIDGTQILDLPLRSSAAAIDVLRQCMRDQTGGASAAQAN